MSTVISVACPGCGTPVLQVPDIDTDETITVDVEPSPDETVELFQAGPAIVCRRRGKPGRAPVHREHDCPWARRQRDGFAEAARAAAHAPDAPGMEQGGWRAP